MKEDITEIMMEEINLIKNINRDFLSKEATEIENIRKYKQEYKPEDILICREERVYKQEELFKQYKNTLLTVRVNYPGVKKNNYISLNIIKILYDLIIKEFQGEILYKKFTINAEGPMITMVVDEDSSKVKLKAVNIEEQHSLGRCVDIDVYNKNGNGLSRSELGFPKRQCYICSDFAQNCVRSRRHTVNEIEEFMKKKLECYKIHL
jgi:holo-ACP synthase